MATMNDLMRTGGGEPTLFDVPAPPPKFDGADYDAERDEARLTGQILRIFDLMKDERYRTLDEITAATGDPQASVSAQLRNLRKEQFGSHDVRRRHRGEKSAGCYEYAVFVPAPTTR